MSEMPRSGGASERALLDELAGVLRNVTRYPHHSHPGMPAVSYMHKPAVLHDRAVTALGLYDRLAERGYVREQAHVRGEASGE